MQVTLWLFGCEVFAFRVGPPDQPEPELEKRPSGPGDCTTYPVGFQPSPGDQRWEKGVEN